MPINYIVVAYSVTRRIDYCIDKLDQALMRPGRIDMTVNLCAAKRKEKVVHGTKILTI